jgi:hypothetical protein
MSKPSQVKGRKVMKKLLTATLFMAMLSICTQAEDGIIQTGLNSTTPQTPPPASATPAPNEATETLDGIIQTGLMVTTTVLQNLLP